MTLRGARVLLAGACTETGQALCEAFVALGAHVFAADRLRTQLEELRAALRQHERLWVAESDLSSPEAALKLFCDVARDEPIDAALLIVPAARVDAWSGDASALEPTASALPRCFWFLRAAIAHLGDAGRVIVVLEPGEGDLQVSIAPAVELLTQRCATQVQALRPGLVVCGLTAAPPLGALLERLVALADPARPGVHGWHMP